MRRLLHVVIALAACGDDSNRHIIDAPMMFDGPNQDVALQPVTLTVTQNGAGVANVVVYFQNADQHVVSATHTDATGVASAVVSPNAFVTAIDPFPPAAFGGVSNQLYTFAGVKPGDHLLLNDNNPPVFSQITINLTLPPSGAGGVVQYSVTMTCADAQYPVARYSAVGSAAVAVGGPVTLYNCTAPVDVLVAAEAGDGQPLETFIKTNQTFTDQQVVDWGGEAYTTAAPRAYTFDNVPATWLDFRVSELTGSTLGAAYDSYGGNFTYASPTTTGTGAVPDIAGLAIVDADIQTDSYAQEHFLDWGPYAATFTTDVGARMLHQFTSIPTATLNTLTWTEDTVGNAPDFAIGQLSNFRAADSRSWSWQYAAPYTAGTLTLPTLPTDVYDFNIAATDSTNLNVQSFAKIPGGYDAIRANVFNLGGPIDITHIAATGSLVVEDAYYFAPGIQRHAPGLFAVKPRTVQKTANVLRHRTR